MKRRANPTNPSFRASSTLATIDAVVIDDDGNPVTDLTRDDFEIKVGGKRQDLQQVVYIRAGSPFQPAGPNGLPNAAESTSPAAAPGLSTASTALKESHGGTGPVTRTIAFVVDDLSLSFESTFYVRRALTKYIETQVQPGDLVAIVRTASGTGALQQFTTDTRLLKMAVSRVQWDFRSRNGIASFEAITPTFSGMGSGADVDGLRSDYTAAGSLGAIQYIARGIEELPGRKSIVLLSEGFPQMFADRLEGGRVWNAMTRMLDEANRAGVVLYTIDARGLQTAGLTAEDNPQARNWGPSGGGPSGSTGPPAGMGGTSGSGGGGGGDAGSGNSTGAAAGGGPPMTGSGAGFLDAGSAAVRSAAGGRMANLIDSQESLQFIANQTGGLAVMNTNDLGRAIDRVLEDQRGYYLLGYPVPPDKLHAGWDHDGVSVKVARPHTHVRARQGFFGPANRKDPSQPVTDPLLTGLLSPFGASGISARLMSAFWHDGKQSYVRSMLFFDANDLHFVDSPFGDKGAYLELAVLAVDGDGQVTASSRHRLRLSLTPAQYHDALKHGVVFRSRLVLNKPGAYQIRAAVRDLDTARLGSSSQFLEVPKVGKGKLALSGVLLKGVEAEPAGAAKDDTLEVVSGLDDNALLAPTIRILRPGSKAVYAYEIYDGLGDASGLEMSATLIRNGTSVYQSPREPVKVLQADKKVRVISIGGSLDLGKDMPSGPYSLQVDVLRQHNGKVERRASQWVDFEVRR